MNKQDKPLVKPPLCKVTLILNEQQSNNFSQIAKQKKLCHGIRMLGKGTIRNHALNLLGLKYQKVVVVDLIVDVERSVEILDCAAQKLKLGKEGHGIAYTTSVNIAGLTVNTQKAFADAACDMEEKSMFRKLTVIVNRGVAEDVMDVARRAGVRGGTILHGRGTGSECAARLFGIEIEPEKELIVIIIPDELTNKVVDDIYRNFRLDIPGNGILFVEPVLEVRGVLTD